MELKRIQVHILPAIQESTHIRTYGNKQGLLYLKEKLKMGYILDGVTCRHLYITSDEEPKIGEQCLYNDKEGNHAFIEIFDKGEIFTPHLCRKIIATTDKKLIINDWVGVIEHKLEGKYEDSNYVPQLEQSFLKEYCKNPDGKWCVEYDMKLPYCTKIRCLLPNCSCTDVLTLKLNQDNTITIHPIKDSWSREEVINILHQYSEETYDKYKEDLKIRNDWIKENL